MTCLAIPGATGGGRAVKAANNIENAIDTAKVFDKGKDAVKITGNVVEGISELTSKNIRFTQDSIASTFKNGSSIDDLVKGLRSGSISPDDIPAIRIFEKDGAIYSLDNLDYMHSKKLELTILRLCGRLRKKLQMKLGSSQLRMVVHQLE